MNKVVLTGRITKDPEVRYTQTGVSVVSFTLAVNRQFRDANGNNQADFINCTAWRTTADFITRYIKKGYMLLVEGSIQTRSYQGQDGQTRYVTEVVCDNVENLQPREQNAGFQGGYQSQPQQPQYQPSYQGFNNPSYGAPQQSYQTPQHQVPTGFNVDVANDDDLPF
jgi:single-strand DNA-binding protein